MRTLDQWRGVLVLRAKRAPESLIRRKPRWRTTAAGSVEPRMTLAEIARRLMPYDRPDGGDVADQWDNQNIGIYVEIQVALTAFIETQRLNRERPTITDVRNNLGRLGVALAELDAAWREADWRTQQSVHNAMGEEPFAAMERKPFERTTYRAVYGDDPAEPPVVELRRPRPLDQWERGAYRVANIREDAKHMADVVAALKGNFDTTPQDPRMPASGLDALIDRLADAFENHVGRVFSTTRNRGAVSEHPYTSSPIDFAQSVVDTLPPALRPEGVDMAVRRFSRERAARRG
jgi:hypothetical protein